MEVLVNQLFGLFRPIPAYSWPIPRPFPEGFNRPTPRLSIGGPVMPLRAGWETT